MSAPICPLLLQARASMVFDVVTYGPMGEADMCSTVADRPLFTEPVSAPGIACIGSRCAWWDPEPDETVREEGSRFTRPTGRGRCGQTRGRNFADPAAVAK